MRKRLQKYLIPDVYPRLRELDLRIRTLETAVQYLIDSPDYCDADDVGFNGQAFRKKIFKDLLDIVDFKIIVETGTWIGNTTGFFANTSGLNVYSCETNPIYHSIAQKRLSSFDNINLRLMDSRKFLSCLVLEKVTNLPTFFYLDAHWHDDLPLAEEISLIRSNWSEFVILVDDFEVPGDKGYGYDKYGKGKDLSMRDFGEVFVENNLTAFFPAATSDHETGHKRGCVILVPNGVISEKLTLIASLRQAG